MYGQFIIIKWDVLIYLTVIIEADRRSCQPSSQEVITTANYSYFKKFLPQKKLFKFLLCEIKIT